MEVECSRYVVLISKCRGFVLLAAGADPSCDGSKPQGLHAQGHAAAR
jgi:hypothetical protein